MTPPAREGIRINIEMSRNPIVLDDTLKLQTQEEEAAHQRGQPLRPAPALHCGALEGLVVDVERDHLAPAAHDGDQNVSMSSNSGPKKVPLSPQGSGESIGTPPGSKEISAQSARKSAASLEAARRGAKGAAQEAADALRGWPLDSGADGEEEEPPSWPKQKLTPNPVFASPGLRVGSKRLSVVAEADRTERTKRKEIPPVERAAILAAELGAGTNNSIQRAGCVSLERDVSWRAPTGTFRSHNLPAANRAPRPYRCSRRSAGNLNMPALGREPLPMLPPGQAIQAEFNLTTLQSPVRNALANTY